MLNFSQRFHQFLSEFFCVQKNLISIFRKVYCHYFENDAMLHFFDELKLKAAKMVRFHLWFF